MAALLERRRVRVTGVVQGVDLGRRLCTQPAARHELAGHVRNDGGVVVTEVEDHQRRSRGFACALADEGAALARRHDRDRAAPGHGSPRIRDRGQHGRRGFWGNAAPA